MTKMNQSFRARLLDFLHDAAFSLPAPVADTVMKLAGPGSPLYPVIRRAQGYKPYPLPSPLAIPDAPIRVLIAPVNFAEQAWQWAHALERSYPNINAQNVMVDFPGALPFRSDRVIPYGVFTLSKDWARKYFEQVSQFTHVLVEAEEPLFGPLFNFSVEKEVRALQSRGVSVAVLSHGSDTRNPRAHARRIHSSPFDENDPKTQLLQRRSDRNRQLIERLGVPVFVSTPDLLDDIPQAHWCPLAINPDEWGSKSSGMGDKTSSERRSLLQVAHIPSRSWLKGSEQIVPVLERLDAKGVVESRFLESVPRNEMPVALGSADLLVEQITMGIYGTTSLEAIGAGCIPIAHIDTRFRTYIEKTTGIKCPIVEAQADTLEETIATLARDKHRRESILEENKRYLALVHDGELSARALYENWISA